jgi:hypothetical protein
LSRKKPEFGVAAIDGAGDRAVFFTVIPVKAGIQDIPGSTFVLQLQLRRGQPGGWLLFLSRQEK